MMMTASVSFWPLRASSVVRMTSKDDGWDDDAEVSNHCARFRRLFRVSASKITSSSIVVVVSVIVVVIDFGILWTSEKTDHDYDHAHDHEP